MPGLNISLVVKIKRKSPTPRESFQSLARQSKGSKRLILSTRWGNESPRHRLTDVAKTWLGLVLSTASNGRIESCGLSAEDREDLIADCSMYLRLLYRHDRSTFHEYLASIRRFIPGYLPRRPLSLRLTAKYLGYERAEALAGIIRPIKDRIRKT
jgi:hypothetical protein